MLIIFISAAIVDIAAACREFSQFTTSPRFLLTLPPRFRYAAAAAAALIFFFAISAFSSFTFIDTTD
jgi:hypothetical protein